MKKSFYFVVFIFCNILEAQIPYTVQSYSQFDLFDKAQKEFKEKKYKESYTTLQSCEGYTPCQTMLGFFYANGLFVDINKTKAITYFENAIDKNSTESMYNLASLYLKDKNYHDAIKYFEMATKNSSKEANYNLGLIYLYGWGVSVDLNKSFKYMQEADTLGYKQAAEPLKWLKKQIK